MRVQSHTAWLGESNSQKQMKEITLPPLTHPAICRQFGAAKLGPQAGMRLWEGWAELNSDEVTLQKQVVL